MEAKLEEKGQTFEELTLDKLKNYTDRIDQEADQQIAKIEEKEAMARENQAKKKMAKKSNMEKEYTKA